jgi:hypothetical protein
VVVVVVVVVSFSCPNPSDDDSVDAFADVGGAGLAQTAGLMRRREKKQ